MGGNVSNLVAEMSEDSFAQQMELQKLKDTHYDSFHELYRKVQDADRENARKKKAYGNGVSVKGIIFCCAGQSSLHRIACERYSGKMWADSEVQQPTTVIDPCSATAFFHAKRDMEMTGCCGGFCYQIYDGEAQKKLPIYISMAYENPYSGQPVVWVKIADGNKVWEGLSYCYNNDKDVTASQWDLDAGKILKVKAIRTTDSTCYVMFGVMSDQAISNMKKMKIILDD